LHSEDGCELFSLPSIGGEGKRSILLKASVTEAGTMEVENATYLLKLEVKEHAKVSLKFQSKSYYHPNLPYFGQVSSKIYTSLFVLF
jgi:hypothetical protein